MILLLGGTTEAAPIAQTLTKAGFEVLLSTATTILPRSGIDAGIRQRTGKLDAQGLADLIRSQGIRIVVDATHPYAAVISANAWTACQQTDIPYVAFDRPANVVDAPGIHWAADHDQAATLACSFGQPVLLTIGTQNLAPYVAAAKLHGTKLIARILDHPSSIEACSRVGLTMEEIVCAKAPFSVMENASLITRHHIGVLVTKDSGDAGGVHTKITAAQDTGCQVVVVKRPLRSQAGYLSIPALMKAIRFSLASDVEGQP